jgi:hypothetical protein
LDLSALRAEREREIDLLLSQYGRGRASYNPFEGL